MPKTALQIIVLLGLLPVIDQAMAAGTNSRTIVVGSEVEVDAVETFEESRGRGPTEEELGAIHGHWLRNEALYREGLAMKLNQDDDVIRERVISRMLAVIDANLRLPPIDDAQLRAWFESRRDRYDEPALYDFHEAVLSGKRSESEVRAMTAALNQGSAATDSVAGMRAFSKRSHFNLAQSYGPDLAKAFQQSVPGNWNAVQTRDGWRALRLDSITPENPATYERFRDVVLKDWKEAVLTEQRNAAIHALLGSYKVIFEPPAHYH